MPLFLRSFSLPTATREAAFFASPEATMTCYQSFYPFGLFRGCIPRLKFAPITILYGGNGSGKTTILNAIAERLSLTRTSPYNKSPFFDLFA